MPAATQKRQTQVRRFRGFSVLHHHSSPLCHHLPNVHRPFAQRDHTHVMAAKILAPYRLPRSVFTLNKPQNLICIVRFLMTPFHLRQRRHVCLLHKKNSLFVWGSTTTPLPGRLLQQTTRLNQYCDTKATTYIPRTVTLHSCD